MLFRRAIVWASLLFIAAAGSGCSTIVGPPPTAPYVTDLQTLFWPPSSLATGVEYTVTGTPQHRLKSNDGTNITDSTPVSGGALRFRISKDSITLDSASTNSIFALPAGSYFSTAVGSYTFYIPFGITSIFSSQDGTRLIVSTDTAGVWYRDPSSIAWIKSTSFVNEKIQCFAGDSSGNLFGAVGSKVYYSTDRGASWYLIGGYSRVDSIVSMACSGNGSLFIATRKGVYYSDAPTIGGFQILGASSFLSVNSLAVGDSSVLDTGNKPVYYEPRVVAATDQGVYYNADNSTSPWRPVSGAGPATAALYNATEKFFIAAGTSGRAWYSAGSTANWAPFSNRTPITSDYKALFDMRDPGGKLMFGWTSDGSIYSMSPNTTSLYSGLNLQNETAYYVCATGGYSGSAKGMGTDFNNVPLGPYATAIFEENGGLLLLTTNGAGLMPGSNWQAGYLKVPQLVAPILITARVITRLDSLAFPGARGYGETYLVRYANEDATGNVNPLSTNYWQIYYSRGWGPVLIEEYALQAGAYTKLSTATLVQK